MITEVIGINIINCILLFISLFNWIKFNDDIIINI